MRHRSKVLFALFTIAVAFGYVNVYIHVIEQEARDHRQEGIGFTGAAAMQRVAAAPGAGLSSPAGVPPAGAAAPFFAALGLAPAAHEPKAAAPAPSPKWYGTRYSFEMGLAAEVIPPPPPPPPEPGSGPPWTVTCKPPYVINGGRLIEQAWTATRRRSGPWRVEAWGSSWRHDGHACDEQSPCVVETWSDAPIAAWSAAWSPSQPGAYYRVTLPGGEAWLGHLGGAQPVAGSTDFCAWR